MSGVTTGSSMLGTKRQGGNPCAQQLLGVQQLYGTDHLLLET
jgi:hypothetical protein